jgi:DNA-binding MarR family transcriptional regulator
MGKSEQIQEIIESVIKLQKAVKPHIWQDEGLSRAQIGMLYMLYYHKGAQMKELAQYLGVSKSAITQLLEQLIAKKLVNRDPSVKDRRAAIISLTPEGLKHIKNFNRYKMEGLRTGLESLSPTEIASLYKLHQKMLNTVKPRE